jgi:hypothetical protein
MRYRTFALIALILGSTSIASAQTIESTPTDETKPTLQQRLMPESTVTLFAPVSAETTQSMEATAPQPTMMAAGGNGMALMIAGAALFVAGLLIEDDAGTVLAVAGAAVGAYGLYVYFQ